MRKSRNRFLRKPIRVMEYPMPVRVGNPLVLPAAMPLTACFGLPGMCGMNTAAPPPEVELGLTRMGMTARGVEEMGWYAHPKLGAPREGPRASEMTVVDAQALLEPLIARRVLRRSLRTMDLLNGCARQCETCCADAPVPTKRFSSESLKGLFADRRFLALLQRDSLRIGSVGDLLNHSQGIEILKMMLAATTPRDVDRIKVYTNYLPQHEAQLDELIALSEKYAERLYLVVSLPLNRSDAINRAFEEYAGRRPRYFQPGLQYRDGLHRFFQASLRNVAINDVRHMSEILNTGRMLSTAARRKSLRDETAVVVPPRVGLQVEQRSVAKVFLNPDALWLKVYATMCESHTMHAYTPLSPQTLSLLQYVPYHSDFRTPPRWRGGNAFTGTWPFERRPLGDMFGMPRKAVVIEDEAEHGVDVADEAHGRSVWSR
jgi:hypothetical protein